MAAEKGSAFLLKIGDGAAPPAFATVAGMRSTQMSVNGEAVVGARQAAIPTPAGGSVVDLEARAAIDALIVTLMSHGLID